MPMGLLRSCVTGHNHKLDVDTLKLFAICEDNCKLRNKFGLVSNYDVSSAEFEDGVLVSLCPPDCPASEAEEKRLENVQQDSLTLEDFWIEWKKRLKRNDLFYEFKAMCRIPCCQKISESATLLSNRAKNMTNLVLPYEYNRVRIWEKSTTESGKVSCYINASWIDGYQHSRKYIATQGPINHTLDEFWNMIWEHECHCIIMVTNLFEHARQQCEKYWHHIHARYGGIDVWLETSHFTSDYEIRNFKIGKSGLSRCVRQFQFQSWSETENPAATTVIEVRRKMHAWMSNCVGPIVVHCSSGAGRTGTFIAIDILLDKVDAKKRLDVLNVVSNLRKERVHMVGTVKQYKFVYQVVANYVVCGNTVMAANSVCCQVQNLSRHVNKLKITGFELQLKNVNHFVQHLYVSECAGGHRTENRWKSRDIMVQPPERARPYLLTHENASSTDFINAVYIDGYRSVNQYIVTQWPLKSTVNDVWRLVHDYQISVIVLLNPGERGSRQYPLFWPTEINQETCYGPVTLRLTDDYNLNKFIRVRSFLLKKMSNAPTLHCLAFQLLQNTNTDSNMERTVVLLQIQCWPNHSIVPDSSQGFLEIVQLANNFYAKLSSSIVPILVISRDGVTRVGPYCVVSIAIERLMLEGEVDIFRTVERVKRNRPQLMEHLMEYIYCYTCAVILSEYYQHGRNLEISEQPKYITSNSNHRLFATNCSMSQSVECNNKLRRYENNTEPQSSTPLLDYGGAARQELHLLQENYAIDCGNFILKQMTSYDELSINKENEPSPLSHASSLQQMSKRNDSQENMIDFDQIRSEHCQGQKWKIRHATASLEITQTRLKSYQSEPSLQHLSTSNNAEIYQYFSNFVSMIDIQCRLSTEFGCSNHKITKLAPDDNNVTKHSSNASFSSIPPTPPPPPEIMYPPDTTWIINGISKRVSYV